MERERKLISERDEKIDRGIAMVVD